MATESPESGVGSGGKLAVELKAKADLGESHVERTLAKRDDLRIAALENYASQKVNGSDAFPLIRAGNIQSSPNKTTSTTGSAHTALGNDDSILKRQGSASFSTGNVPRSSRSNSPTKRPVAAIIENYHDIVGNDSQTGSQEQPPVQPAAPVAMPPSSLIEEEAAPAMSEPTSGLDFLLQACDILEPGATELMSGYRKAPRNGGGSSRRPSFELQQQVVTTSRGRASRRPSDEGEFDYTPGHSSEDEDDYRPARARANGRPARRAASRAVAATTAAAMSGGAVTSSGGKGWERGLVSGPCTNPDCEHPYDSPQWRKGPPTNPILCNACGTRWLRNGSLKPLVPRRGIRYGKARPKGSVKAAAEARAEAAAARSARREASELAALHHQQHQQQQGYHMMNEDGYDEEEGYYEEEMVAAPAPAPRRRHVMAPPVAAPSQPLPIAEMDPTHAMMTQAMAAVFPGFGGAPGFFGMPQQSMHAAAAADPVMFQQQLMAMTAAAQAAQQAFYAAQMEMQQQQHQNNIAMVAAEQQPQCNEPTIMKPAGDGLPVRPVFNIQAVAAPYVAAPRFEPQS